MSISPWQIYLLTRLDDVRSVAFAVIACCGVALISIGVCQLAEEFDSFNLWLKRLLITLACSVFVLLVAPNTQQMAAIIVIPRIANSQTVNELGEATVTLAKQWLEELKPKQKEVKQ